MSKKREAVHFCAGVSFTLSGGQCDSMRGGVNPFVRSETQEV